MIVLKATLNVLPEKRLEITQTLLSMIEPTAKEVGCLNYSIFCDLVDKNRFNLLEEWKTREDLEYHIKSIRFGVLLGLKSLLYEPMKIKIFSVSQVEGMEVVHSARSIKTE